MVVADVNIDGAEKTVAEVGAAGGRATAVAVDLRDSAQIEQMIETGAAARAGGHPVNQVSVLDIAFAPADTYSETLPEAAWDAVSTSTPSVWLRSSSRRGTCAHPTAARRS